MLHESNVHEVEHQGPTHQYEEMLSRNGGVSGLNQGCIVASSQSTSMSIYGDEGAD